MWDEVFVGRSVWVVSSEKERLKMSEVNLNDQAPRLLSEVFGSVEV
jgi:hypothetical protein